MAETSTAHVFQISASGGGVPKKPLAESEVSFLGLTSDRQADTRHHGGPERALCLYALEHILALQAEGHPIYPGATGENVTIAGLDWSLLIPGTRLQLGQIEVEVTGYASPCNTIRDAFRDRDFSRISQKKYPGWSRVYVRVLRGGTIRVADPVSLSP